MKLDVGAFGRSFRKTNTKNKVAIGWVGWCNNELAILRVRVSFPISEDVSGDAVFGAHS